MIDLRSDTVTMPTDEMREAMCHAIVGDDVYKSDPTINALEDYAAKLVGKEKALFVPSGTAGNQLALFTHCVRGEEVILGEDCHIVKYEAGASAIIAGVQLRTLPTHNGIIDLDKVKKSIQAISLHNPKTALICVENAYSNGKVVPLKVMKEIYELAKENDVLVHLDGARVFNAATHLDVDVKEITQYCDSVMFCLSKGLCAPVGSILAGSSEFIDEALMKRKIMGGGMRQVGILGAAGQIALEKMTKRLKEDHNHAQLLGQKLNQLKDIQVPLDDIDINMVFCTINKPVNPDEMVAFFLEKGIIINPPHEGIIRFVTHHDIKEKDIDFIVDQVAAFLS